MNQSSTFHFQFNSLVHISIRLAEDSQLQLANWVLYFCNRKRPEKRTKWALEEHLLEVKILYMCDKNIALKRIAPGEERIQNPPEQQFY